jgi:hypothetical protein
MDTMSKWPCHNGIFLFGCFSNFKNNLRYQWHSLQANACAGFRKAILSNHDNCDTFLKDVDYYQMSRKIDLIGWGANGPVPKNPARQA